MLSRAKSLLKAPKDLLARRFASRQDAPRHELLQFESLIELIDAGRLLDDSKLRRLGSRYGGWIIPTDAGLSAQSVCYCVGAGEDLSFDCELVRVFGCKVRIVDPTPRAVTHFKELRDAIGNGLPYQTRSGAPEPYTIEAGHLSNIVYLPVGLSDKDEKLKFYLPANPDHVSCSTENLQKTENFFWADCRRLSTLMAEQGDASVDLLKIDVEGAEYSIIRDLVSSNLLPDILLIEFDEVHMPLDENAGQRIPRPSPDARPRRNGLHRGRWVQHDIRSRVAAIAAGAGRKGFICCPSARVDMTRA